MAFGATGIIDNFDRTNATTLGANWTLLQSFSGSGDYGISSNLLYNPDSGGYYSMYYNAATYGPNCEVYITISTTLPDSKSDYGINLIARIADPGSTWDGYWLGAYNSGTVEVWEIDRDDNGSFTRIGATVNQEIEDGNKVGFELIGSTLKGYIDTGGGWTEVISRTDETYNSAGYVGVYGSGLEVATWRFNDFGGGTLSTGTWQATGNGNITNLGGDASCDKRGFVYGTSSVGTTPGNVAPGSSGYSSYIEDSGSYSTGAFTKDATSLTENTTYYMRAYAHNTQGYAYGEEVNFYTGTGIGIPIAMADYRRRRT